MKTKEQISIKYYLLLSLYDRAYEKFFAGRFVFAIIAIGLYWNRIYVQAPSVSQQASMEKQDINAQPPVEIWK